MGASQVCRQVPGPLHEAFKSTRLAVFSQQHQAVSSKDCIVFRLSTLG
jgi:hypothetical protein